MARHEGMLKAQAGADMAVLLRSFGVGAGDRSRSAAIACVLSGADGWEAALAELGGTFASAAPSARSAQEE